jgi:hypothetical protein
VLGHLAVDIGAERLADPLALSKPRDHAVEPCLEKPDLASVIDDDLLLQGSRLHALYRRPHPLHGVGDRAGRRRDQDPAGEQADHHEEEDRRDQFVAARVTPSQERNGDGDQRNTRAKRPGDQQARAGSEDATRLASGGDLPGEREGEHGSQRPLAEQIADRRGGEPGEHDADHHPGDVFGRVMGRRDHAEKHRGGEPPCGHVTGGP